MFPRLCSKILSARIVKSYVVNTICRENKWIDMGTRMKSVSLPQREFENSYNIANFSRFVEDAIWEHFGLENPEPTMESKRKVSPTGNIRSFGLSDEAFELCNEIENMSHFVKNLLETP
jgi:hypothetical protein